MGRSTLRRAGAAIATAAATLMLAALPAAADPVTGQAQHEPKAEGWEVKMGDGNLSEIQPTLFTLKLSDGTTLRVYCVEIHVNLIINEDMVEVPWDAYPGDGDFDKNRAKINWVLHNGFPGKSLEDLNKIPGVEWGEDGLEEREAISATQAAVWHFSDGVDLNKDNPTPTRDDAKKDVLALYNYLVGEANTGIEEQPNPALQVSPESQTGEAGKLVGPFTVSTNGGVTEIVKNLPEGVTLTDKDGKEIAAADIKDGTELFLKVPADAKAGEGDFKLKGQSKVDTGRLFVVKDENKRGQSLIVADSHVLKVEAGAKGDWKIAPTTPPVTTTTPPVTTTTTAPPVTTTTTTTPVPQGSDLPDTGASILLPVLIGVGLVGAGTGAVIYQRRRRAA
ncbi:thioester domain-containing protein [Actinokineospora sp. HUAS TT18]|uniref:thioester domain-containing protein n=1 Tax=Actinokineospora sp. HUAS TT18 TaxID=3447451 RepID=UPI003F5262DC